MNQPRITKSIFLFVFGFFLYLTNLFSSNTIPEYTKISVICPTYNRPHLHHKLYQAFAWQTYENRELLILDDSPTPSTFFTQLKDPKVKYFHQQSRSSIGHKRNFLIEQASGEVIAHFDDDDYYAPNYLSEMFDHLQKSDADLTKLSRWLAWRELDGSLWEWDTRFIENVHFVIKGTSKAQPMIDLDSTFLEQSEKEKWTFENLWGFGFSYFYKKSLWKEFPFNDMNFGEDYDFISRAKNSNKKIVHTPDWKHLVLHTIHQKNCSRIFPQYHHPSFLCSELLEKNSTPWLVTLSKNEVINKELLTRIYQPFFEKDPYLKLTLEKTTFDNYKTYYIESDSYHIENQTRDYIKHNFIKHGIPWEPIISELFQKYVKEGSTAIDIGGHIGIHTLSLSKLVGNEGIVHVFEPQAKLFLELILNMHLNNCKNIVFHRTALGTQRSLTEMAPRNINNEGNTMIGFGGDPVPMQPLDDFEFKNLSLVKIDVEEYEMEVLNGAIKTILKHKPVLIVEIWNDSNQIEKIKKIESLGYQAYNIKTGFPYDFLFVPKN